MFEELAIDVYDEVDRRETDSVWNTVEVAANAVSAGVGSKPAAAASAGGNAAVIIPFLPVNPEFGTTRNQGRQKLARLSGQEFEFLVTDILKEIRRRQSESLAISPASKSPLREAGTPARSNNPGFTKSLPQFSLASAIVDPNDPIYDYVASDDDYYHIPDHPTTQSYQSAAAAADGSSNDSPRGSRTGMR